MNIDSTIAAVATGGASGPGEAGTGCGGVGMPCRSRATRWTRIHVNAIPSGLLETPLTDGARRQVNDNLRPGRRIDYAEFALATIENSHVEDETVWRGGAIRMVQR